MTAEEFEETLQAAMRAYESARAEAQEQQPVVVEVQAIPYQTPPMQAGIFCAAVFLAGLCAGILIGGMRREHRKRKNL